MLGGGGGCGSGSQLWCWQRGPPLIGTLRKREPVRGAGLLAAGLEPHGWWWPAEEGDVLAWGMSFSHWGLAGYGRLV